MMERIYVLYNFLFLFQILFYLVFFLMSLYFLVTRHQA